MTCRIDIVRDIDAFCALEIDWNRLVGRFFGGHPFFSHFWFVNYYRSYFPGRPLFVMTARDDSGDLIAALPMVLGRRRLAGIPLKEARLVVGEHSHVNRILAPPHEEEIVRAFLCRARDEGIDLIYLEDVPDDSPDRTWMEAFCRTERLMLEVRRIRSSPYIPTTGDFEEYRKRLSKKFRELLNNRLNRINRAGGYEIETLSKFEHVDRAIADMETISAGSWQGREGSGLFSGEANSRFYRNLISHAMANGYGTVFILYFGGRPAAYELHLFAGKTEYCLKAEYALEFEEVSPGAVLDAALIKRAFGSDIDTYDLLGYTDSYKLRWTQACTPYLRYFIFARSAAGVAAYNLYYRLGNRLRHSGILRRMKKRVS
jgi:CelD/BcsL family acetyltransferase involved in cellulose biosynthesis